MLKTSRPHGWTSASASRSNSGATWETGDVIATYLVRRGLLQQQISLGASVGLLNSVINIILLVSGNYLARRISGESLW